ncbi:hypothetical protein ACEWY4_014492 [Coilia grayii]|uniref:Chemokine interleukin-8-like domain-containing protein n=1 Tax=Coilia grayii TaxID=363190 RepID=A0ABD1JSE6_9TELE
MSYKKTRGSLCKCQYKLHHQTVPTYRPLLLAFPENQAMKFSILFFILLLACMCPVLAQGSYENCCLKYVVGIKKSTKRKVEKYRLQETDGGCNIPAVIFTLRSSRSFCANPQLSWVQRLMGEVNARSNNKRM